MISVAEEAISNAVEATKEERRQIRHVQRALGQAAVAAGATAYLLGPDGKGIPLPEPLFHVLRHAAGMLVRGERITIAPVIKELSTQEAADLLDVSRPYFVKLLGAGDIPFTRVGRHRRVFLGDLNDYRRKRDAERRDRLHEMIRKSEEVGLYDIEEFRLERTR